MSLHAVLLMCLGEWVKSSLRIAVWRSHVGAVIGSSFRNGRRRPSSDFARCGTQRLHNSASHSYNGPDDPGVIFNINSDIRSKVVHIIQLETAHLDHLRPHVVDLPQPGGAKLFPDISGPDAHVHARFFQYMIRKHRRCRLAVATRDANHLRSPYTFRQRRSPR